MYTKYNNKPVGRIGLILFLCVCAAGAADRPAVSEIEVRANQRGLVLVINGTGPIHVDLGGQPTERYSELRVRINGARSAIGNNQLFTPPEGMLLGGITVTEDAGGVTIVARGRGHITGPTDIRTGPNQARILMTSVPQPVLTWTAAKAPAPAPPAPAAPAGGAAEPAKTKTTEERTEKNVTPAAQTVAASNEPPAAVQPPRPSATQTQPRPAAAPQQRRTAAPPPVIAPQRGETPSGTEEPAGDTPAAPTLVRYSAFGRDPFVPLMKDTAMTDLPRVESLRLVGILEDASERIALVEDFRNNNRAFALRANDPIEDGRVLRIHRDRVVFVVREFDVSRSYTLSLTR